VLAAAVLGGCLLRWMERGRVPEWNSDEGISYLMSSCAGRKWEETIVPGSSLYGKWVPAAEWQRLIDPNGRLCFGTVARDLAELDVHPPLYFWMLHLWTLLFGRSIAAGMALNCLLWAVTSVALYRLARLMLAGRAEAVAVVAIACAARTSIEATLQFRPYILLALVTVLFVLALERCLASQRRARARDYAYLAAATMAGVLTHHLFWFVIAACAPYAIAVIVRRDLRRLVPGVLSSAAGVGVAALVFPFAQQISQNSGARAQGAPGLAFAAAHMGSLLSDFILAPWSNLGALTVALVATVAWTLLLRRVPQMQVASTSAWTGARILILIAAVAGALTLQMAVGLAPKHATAPKYFASLWPLVALVPVFASRAARGFRAALLVGICTLYVTVAAQTAARGRLRLEPPSLKRKYLLIDSVQRLHLPRVLERIDPRAMLFVATQSDLLASDAWRRPTDPIGYLSCAATGDAKRGAGQLRALLAETHRQGRGGNWGRSWRLYEFRPKR
jgi:hypothetical protein